MNPDALYIALFIRDDPPKPNDYHWALYYHHRNGGTKYHIRNEGNGWMAAHGPESAPGILKTFLLVGLFQIAQVPSTALAQETLDRVFRSYDDKLNGDEKFTCRTWVLHVLRDLQRELGILHGINLEMLEKEILEWGNHYRFDASRNVQPRPSNPYLERQEGDYLTALMYITGRIKPHLSPPRIPSLFFRVALSTPPISIDLYNQTVTMRIVDPQSAVLTNIEVLAYVTANPPRRPPNPPPNSRHWVPSPDLRDHNTVIKEIHNYATRLSPHILNYPKYTHLSPSQIQAQAQTQQSTSTTIPPAQLNAPTPLDHALRELVTRLQPYGLTKGEVLMIVNLGVGLITPTADGDNEAGEGEEGESMEQDNGEETNGMDVDGAEACEEQGEGEIAEEDYGALALMDTVIEEREERLSNEDVANILAIIRETLGSKSLSQGEGMDEEG
ncbi:uncharacterized protein BO80DRAFT_387916 [Aspergillus ibericus CBS 121593]|uniref:Uncharacterized protein n=1 Tax=Aspergillus ibericus CBS 121593 TaxID=1448316 RepID=A0A395GS47_9EURO|nr:hypothetical protein BO80DRAFT_387916 [Aspergillus ibericus CBS 121593]RAK98236.1 hypothetical protein BO80DRAFT_387916 [Aspergillus ibericus CBS 121593]